MNRKEALEIIEGMLVDKKSGALRLNTNGMLDAFVKLGMIDIEDDAPEPVLCKEDADWNWWLLQTPEFKSTVIRFLRAARNAGGVI